MPTLIGHSLYTLFSIGQTSNNKICHNPMLPNRLSPKILFIKREMHKGYQFNKQIAKDGSFPIN